MTANSDTRSAIGTPARRVRLAGFPLVIAFALIVSGALMTVFPQDGDCSTLAGLGGRPDAFSIAYLEAIAKSSPKEARCPVLEYAHSLAAMGRHSEALQWIARLPRDASTVEAELDLQIAFARSLSSDDPRRAELRAAIHSQLVADMVVSAASARHEELAKVALEWGWPGLAAQYYRKLAETEGPRTATFLREAGRWHLAAGEPSAAAECYEQAAARATDAAALEQDGLSAVAALEANGDVGAASKLIEGYAARLPDHTPLLRRAMSLAIAGGRPDAARRIGTLLVASGQATEKEALAQIRREVAAGNLRVALEITKELVRRDPGNPDLRRLEARLAEQSGDNWLAFRDWAWLSQ